MGFDPRVKKAMEELFSGKKCCTCGKQAQRLYAKEHYFCHDCFDPPETNTVEIKETRDYITRGRR